MFSRSLPRLGAKALQECGSWRFSDTIGRCDRDLSCLSSSLERVLSGSHASCSGTSDGAQSAEASHMHLPASRRMFSMTSIAQSPEPSSGAPSSELNPLLQAPPPGDGKGGGGGIRVSSHGPGKAGAKLRGISMSPKKINLFATLVRRMHVDDALAQCRLHPKKAGKIIAGVISSAMANAENNHGMDPSRLAIETINVGSGQHLKKLWIHGRGRSSVRRLYRTNMEVVVAETDKRARMKYVPPLLERRRQKSEPRGLDTAFGGLR